MSENPSIFLAGASRGVGREVAQLLAKSYSVKALLRTDAAQAELESLGITTVRGDALDPTALEAAMRAEPVGAVISTVGGLPKDGQRADYLGNKNLVDAALKAGVQKFILVSSIGSGNSAGALPPAALETLRPVLIEKAQAEEYLIASGLTYVIIRPGGLKSEPATGNGVLTPDPTIAGTIHRADVARLVCQCLDADQADNRVLSAVDRQMTYGQADFEVLSFS
ncbi:MAG: SDR family oxidoreductase [Leptolyngbyaceae cyanobacterium CSU_1_4]|nr:SDR family oxidoreductase [Leptolyngbyaceae cyanobacterium CSU_1_4]